MGIRLIILVTILTILDFYAFQAIKTLTKSQWVQGFYVLLSVGVIGYLVYSFITYDRSVGPTKESLRVAGLFLLFFVPKLVLLIFMFGEDIIRVIVGGYNYMTDSLLDRKAAEFIPSRRKFVSQLGLGVAAIPFASLLYGMFKGKYNFKVLTHVLYLMTYLRPSITLE